MGAEVVHINVIDVHDPVLLLAPLPFLTDELVATAADHAGRRGASLQVVPADRGLARSLPLRPLDLVDRCHQADARRPDVNIFLAPPDAALEPLVHGSQLVVLPRTFLVGRARHGVLASRPVLALALPGHVPGRLVVALLRDDDSDHAVVRLATREAVRRGHELRLLLAANRRAGPVAAGRAYQVLADWEALLSQRESLVLSAATDSWGADRLLASQGQHASLVVLATASLAECRLPRGDLLVVPPDALTGGPRPLQYQDALEGELELDRHRRHGVSTLDDLDDAWRLGTADPASAAALLPVWRDVETVPSTWPPSRGMFGPATSPNAEGAGP